MFSPYKALCLASLSSVHPNREPKEFQGSIQALEQPLLSSPPTSSERSRADVAIY